MKYAGCSLADTADALTTFDEVPTGSGMIGAYVAAHRGRAIRVDGAADPGLRRPRGVIILALEGRRGGIAGPKQPACGHRDRDGCSTASLGPPPPPRPPPYRPIYPRIS